MKPELPLVSFSTQKAWEEYLSKHYADESGVWIKLAKKGSGVTLITHDEALEVALMYGWIDGLAHTIDDKFWSIKFTPRRPKGMWSKRNCEIVERLIKQKKMQQSGLAQVESAKKDGRWEAAYDSPKNMMVPEDFLKELAKDKKAEAFFKTLNRANTYAIAWRLHTAKTPETRERRMNVLLDKMKRGEKIH